MTFFILFLATLLRLVLLNQSLWLDESIQALAVMGRMGPILNYATADFHPPFYHFVLIPWVNVFGTSEIALRLPSAILGVASVYILIKLAELFVPRKYALLAGALLALNPLHIYYSQENRMYMMASFLVLGSYYFFLKLLKSKQSSFWKVVPYLLFTVFALHTDYLAWIAIALQLFYLLISKNLLLLKWAAIPWISLLWWLPFIKAQLAIGEMNKNMSTLWRQVVGGFAFKSIPLTWIKFVIGRITFYNRLLYAGLALLIFLVTGLPLIRSWNKKTTSLWLWFAGTAIIAWLISLFIPVYSYFRLLFLLPAFVLLIVVGLEKISFRNWLISAIVGIQALSLLIFWFNPVFQREDWRSLAAYINKRSVENSIAVLPSLGQNAPFLYYGLKSPLEEARLANYEGFNKVFFVNYSEDLFDPARLGRQRLQEEGFIISEEKVFPYLHLIIYSR